MAIEGPFAVMEGASAMRQANRETLINMYAELEQTGRTRLIRRQRAGVNLLLENTGTKRCIERHKNFHYLIIDDKFYRFNGTSLTELGTLSTSTGRCTMVFNDNNQVMISDGRNGYFWNGSELASVSAPTRVGYLAYQGGFAIYNAPDTGQFYVTGINDFSTVDALDFATAESYPDNLLRPFVDHNELWLFGSRSTEVWQLSGSADFPFARFTNAQIERGILGPLTVAADDNTVFWLGDDAVVYRAEGYRPQRISTHPVERAIEEVSASAKQSAYAMLYTKGGHKFYTLTFPGELTLQFNIATGFWNRAQTWGSNSWDIFSSNGHYVDYFLTDGGICTLVDGLSTDEGRIMYRGGISPPVYMEGNRLSIPWFWFDAEVGRADLDVDANIMLQVSRDGGETFGNERWRSLGPMGSYRRRAVWRNLGQARNFVVKFGMTDPTELKIVGARGDVRMSVN